MMHNTPLSMLVLFGVAALAQGQVERLPPLDMTAGTMAAQYVAPASPMQQPASGPVSPLGLPGPTDFAAPPGSLAPSPNVLPGPGPAPASPPPVICDPGCLAPEEDPDVPRDARKGFFQKVFLTDTWLARLGDGGFGMNDLEAGAVFALPFPTRTWPLLITPGFIAHWLDGPAGVDLPPRVYEAYTEFRWLPRFTQRLRADAAIMPTYNSDFRASRDALRITGYGAGIWQWTPKMKLVLGASYLDRHDVAVLPIAGISWHPSDDWKLDLVFPKPKIARRIGQYGTLCPASGGSCCPEIEYWLYVAGELGGGIWAFEHTDGIEDVFSYRDYRLMLGIERKVFFGLDSRLEVGYAFNRRIEFQSGLPDVEPGDTVMVRGALTY
jgi:hypothetical protein